jgi:CheY-like chemotaxis protein
MQEKPTVFKIKFRFINLQPCAIMPQSLKGSRMAGEKIYYVEDEHLPRNDLTKLLTESGYDVTAFANVNSAMEHMGWRPEASRLTSNLPDAIITDNQTPGIMNGFDMLRAAKDANIPRMMLTGDIRIMERDVIAAGGSQAKLLFKPCNEKELLTALGSMVAKGAREL